MFANVEAELRKDSKPDFVWTDCEMVMIAIGGDGSSNKSVLGWKDGLGLVEFVKGRLNDGVAFLKVAGTCVAQEAFRRKASISSLGPLSRGKCGRKHRHWHFGY